MMWCCILAMNESKSRGTDSILKQGFQISLTDRERKKKLFLRGIYHLIFVQNKGFPLNIVRIGGFKNPFLKFDGLHGIHLLHDNVAPEIHAISHKVTDDDGTTIQTILI